MTDELDRRQVLKTIGTSGAIIAATSVAGCSAPTNGSTDGGTGDGGGNGGEETTTTEGGDGGDSDSGGEWTETDTVDMTDDLTFAPAKIQVSAGTTVTWENVGAIGHTITAYADEIPDGAAYFASGGYDSEEAARDGYPENGNITEGESYEHTFDTPGTYEYFCIPHELNGMVGTVKVV